MEPDLCSDCPCASMYQDHGIDPVEQFKKELREKVADLKAKAADVQKGLPFEQYSSRAEWLGKAQAYSEVLSLLEPKKP